MSRVRHSLIALSVFVFSSHLVTGQTLAVVADPGPAAQAAPPAVDMVAPPAWMFSDLACAPTISIRPASELRVIGSQDTVIKHMLGPGDTLVINGGAGAGLQAGQMFFVRRHLSTFGAPRADGVHPVNVHTTGWVRLLGVDAGVATATVVGACEGILLDDYLEPFTPPMVAARMIDGTPQYANMGRVMTSDEGRENVGGFGALTNIDRGSNQGVVPGQRYLVFRDKRGFQNASPEYSAAYVAGAPKLPLVEVGEVVVVAARPETSTVQVLISRDVIASGDLIAEIR